MTAPRRRWSFSLRTLLVMVALLACWLGWQLHAVRERKAALSQIANAWGKAKLQGDWTQSSFIPATPSRIRGFLGDRLVQQIWLQPSMANDLDCIRRIFPEADVDVDDDLPKEPAADAPDVPKEFQAGLP